MISIGISVFSVAYIMHHVWYTGLSFGKFKVVPVGFNYNITWALNGPKGGQFKNGPTDSPAGRLRRTEVTANR